MSSAGDSTDGSDKVENEIRQGIVVAGEASESDDEEETTTVPSSDSLPPLKVNHLERGDSVELPEKRLSQTYSDSEEREALPKYDTLLHRKLRDRNVAFRKHLCATFGQLYLSAAKDINHSTSQLIKSHAAIQETSNHLRYMTNDLFQLEDKINIIANCNILPEIVMKNK